MSKLNLEYLAQFKVTAKGVVDMSIEEARHECKIVDSSKKEGEANLSVQLQRKKLSMNNIVPNSDCLRLPLAEVEKVTEQLKLAIAEGYFDDFIGERIQELKDARDKKVKTTETKEVVVSGLKEQKNEQVEELNEELEEAAKEDIENEHSDTLSTNGADNDSSELSELLSDITMEETPAQEEQSTDDMLRQLLGG